MRTLEGDIWTEAQPFWSSDAVSILNQVGRGNSVVIHGPHRVGKSRLLISELVVQGEKQGLSIMNAGLEGDSGWGQAADMLFEAVILTERLSFMMNL